jgi:acetyl esterase/lipase
MDGADLLDPTIAAVADTVPIPDMNADVLPTLRGAPLGLVPELSDEVERTDHVVSRDPEVVVRVHRRKGLEGALPCVYSIHGGGYILGSYTMDDTRFDSWCRRFDVVGVSVEYRLAPETPFPGPLDDCDAGLGWVVEHADELGVDPDRIGVSGISAGGGLAASLALRVRDRGTPQLRFQLLECPMLDDRQTTPSSRLDRLLVWSRLSNEFGWRSYLGELYGTDDVPYVAAPARCEDLRGLPPTFLAVGGADGFRDEDIDYALRLSQAGVPTELHVYPGAPHGVQMFVDNPIVQQWQRDEDEWLGRQLAALDGAARGGS